MHSFIDFEGIPRSHVKSHLFYSLAAYSLQQIGLLNATDVIGGYEAWKDAELPVSNEPERRNPRSLVSLAGSVV